MFVGVTNGDGDGDGDEIPTFDNNNNKKSKISRKLSDTITGKETEIEKILERAMDFGQKTFG